MPPIGAFTCRGPSPPGCATGIVTDGQVPSFSGFDSELWKDYLLRFQNFFDANSVADENKSLVFLTNQTSETYKLINTYGSQLSTPTTAKKMSFEDVTKFWSSIKRKPGEMLTELANRWQLLVIFLQLRIPWMRPCVHVSFVLLTMRLY